MKNIDKIVYYLRMVSKHDINVDGEITHIHRECIRLSDSFFYKDDCIGCGACCAVVPEDNILIQDEYDILQEVSSQYLEEYGLDPQYIEEARSNFVKEIHTVNGFEVPIYRYHGEPNEIWVEHSKKTKKSCHWMVFYNGRYRCMIHPARSITCRIPHLKFRYSKKGTVSIGVSQYGRNWAIGCPIKFESPVDEAIFNTIKQDRIDTLRRLRDVGNYLHVDTYLDDIINYVESIPYENYQQYIGKPIIEFHKVKTFGDGYEKY